jgi:uncharacterized protein
MRIDVRSVLRDIGSSISVELHCLPEEIELSFRDFQFSFPVVFSGEVKSISRNVIALTGTVQTEVETECVRCLEPVTFPVKEGIISFFRSGSGYRQAQPAQDDEEEAEYNFRGHTLSPDKALVDAIILALPLKVLCTEDCKGIDVSNAP